MLEMLRMSVGKSFQIHGPTHLINLIVLFISYVAVTTMDMEFLSIDFNPCPISIGNQLPNYFQNIPRCKPSTIVSFKLNLIVFCLLIVGFLSVELFILGVQAKVRHIRNQ